MLRAARPPVPVNRPAADRPGTSSRRGAGSLSLGAAIHLDALDGPIGRTGIGVGRLADVLAARRAPMAAIRHPPEQELAGGPGALAGRGTPPPRQKTPPQPHTKTSP